MIKRPFIGNVLFLLDSREEIRSCKIKLTRPRLSCTERVAMTDQLLTHSVLIKPVLPQVKLIHESFY